LAKPVAGAATFGDVIWQKLVDAGIQPGLALSTPQCEVSRLVGKLAAVPVNPVSPQCGATL
jgi:hypothetical protein